jgi:hypothetical protein
VVRTLIANAQRGVSHPNTDLDAQTFLMRVRALRKEAGMDRVIPVTYQPQVSESELADPRILIWDIGRSYQPALGNFDHHQNHELGATPIILAEALGTEPNALDRYVDLGDRGEFFKKPQPFPLSETLHGMSGGINLLHRQDSVRSVRYQELLAWVEATGQDPFGRFPVEVLPEAFRPFAYARGAEEEEAEKAARGAQWFSSRLGKVAFVTAESIGVMRVLYNQGAAVVIHYEPHYRMSGWGRSARKYTIGANPSAVSIPDQLDLGPLFVRLSSLEPTGHSWGGHAGIGGSPREEGGTDLSAGLVLRETLTFLG